MKTITTTEHGIVVHRIMDGKRIVAIRSHPLTYKCMECEG